MALNVRVSDAAANAQADAVTALLAGGWLRMYDGAQPASTDTPAGARTLLAELIFAIPAAPAAVAGVATFNQITQDSGANAGGTATWFRCLKVDGTTVVFDGSVGMSGANLNLNRVAIQVGAVVQVTGLTFTAPKG